MNRKPVKIINNVLVDRISFIISEARQRTVLSVNTILVKTYWEIGREIVEHELSGKGRAEYGTSSLQNLAAELANRYGKGFSYPNLRRMCQFYADYEIFSTLSRKFEKSILSTP